MIKQYLSECDRVKIKKRFESKQNLSLLWWLLVHGPGLVLPGACPAYVNVIVFYYNKTIDLCIQVNCS